MSDAAQKYQPPGDRRLLRTENLVLFVLAMAGITAFALRYPNLQPASGTAIEVGRAEAARIAISHLQDLGYQVAELDVENVSFRTDHAWNAFLQSEAADPEALRKFKPDRWWAVLLAQTAREVPAQIRVGPDGTVFWVSHPVPRTQAGDRLTPAQAQALASTFFRDVVKMPLTGWTLQNSRVDQLGGRSDHTLSWQRPIEGSPGSLQTLGLVISGSKVSSWSRSAELSDDFRSRYGPKETLHTFMDFGLLLLVTLIWLSAMVVFALRFRSSEVGVKNGFLAVFALMLVFIWFGFNTAPYTAHSAIVNPESPFQLAFVYVGLGIQAFFTSLGLFFVWNAGESLAREAWPSKLASFDKLFAQRFLSRDIGAGVLRGGAMAAITLGTWYLLLPLFSDGQWTIVGQEELLHLSAVFPPGFALASGLLTALLGSAYAHLFSLALLRLRTKRVWLAVAITAILFGTFFSETTVILDRRIGAVLSIVTGLISYWFFLRHDLWTVFCGLFFASVVLFGTLYVTHPAFRVAGMISLAFVLVALIYGGYSVVRGEAVEDDAVSPNYVRHISERERLKLELDIARRAQLRMLPARVPDPAGLEVAAFSEPAREVGGDYYDFLQLPGDRLGVVVGDVSGKGMSAALYMTMLKGYLQSRSESDPSPISVLAHVNRMFGLSSDRSMFATMVFCVFDLGNRRMTFARAGHCPVLVYRAADSLVYVLQPQGIGIGLERSDLFERLTKEESLDLQAGDVVLLYSDGIPEARDAQDNEFGRQRLIDIMKEPSSSAEDILTRIRAAHRSFVGGQEPHDDLTCVVVRVTGTDSDTEPKELA